MSGHRTSSRLERLDQLQGLLKAREHVTLADLARELDVSIRTVNRDIELLRERGLPIDADRGRGGGHRLDRRWSVGRLHLSPAEAIDTLLSLAIAEMVQSPLLLAQLAAIRRKISVAFPDHDQERIRMLRKRILIGKPASAPVLTSYQPGEAKGMAAISAGFFNMQCLQIDYHDQNGSVTKRHIEPHYLVFNMPVWYLLAWDRLRNAIRFFRIDRIEAAILHETSFRLCRRADFMAHAENEFREL